MEGRPPYGPPGVQYIPGAWYPTQVQPQWYAVPPSVFMPPYVPYQNNAQHAYAAGAQYQQTRPNWGGEQRAAFSRLRDACKVGQDTKEKFAEWGFLPI